MLVTTFLFFYIIFKQKNKFIKMFENQNNFSYNLIILKKLIYNNVMIIFSIYGVKEGVL